MLTTKEIDALMKKIASGEYTMADVLDEIARAQHGEDIRASMYGGLYTCYRDGKAGAIDLIARQQIAEMLKDDTSGLEIQQGIQSVTLTAGELKSVAITYDKAFSGVPAVLISSNNINAEYSTTGRTASGFTLNVQSTADGAAEISWIAIYGGSEAFSELTDLRVAFDGTTYATAGEAVRGQAEKLLEEIEYQANEQNRALQEETERRELQTGALLQSYIDEEKGTVSLLDGVSWTSGYYLNAGVPAANTNYSYCSYIDVSGMSEITITNVSRCDYAFYDADMNVLGLSRDGWATISDASTTTLTPHEDAVYFRFSCRTEDIANNSVTTISADDATVYTLNRNIENNDGAVLRGMVPAIGIVRDILAENEVMANTDVSGNEVPHVKYNYDISFSAKITGFGGIHIAHGYQKYNASKVTIDDTYITVYKYTTSETEVFKQAHGLIISGFINATIKVGVLSARLILSSSSGTFISEEFEWRGARPLVRAYAFPGTKLTDCKLIWSSNALKRGIWWYGDSYVDGYGKLLEEYGYDNAMFDGFSGRSSAGAWDSLCSGLKFSNPNVIVWGMGMNDADNASSVNGVWKTYAQKVIDLCKARQIELIFLTIPNVPNVNNTYKNEFIKASGCSYIDIASAVGGTETGSSWYDGLLGADELHPSDIGKQVIASYITAQLPQLRRL